MTTSASSPRQLGYRWPAEWEPHDATWLAWPHKEASWPGKFEPVPKIFVEMVRALVPGERVEILVGDAVREEQVRVLLLDGGVPLERVGLHRIPTDDSWIRDHGPIFVVGRRPGELAALDWGYNAWGGKYPPWELDDQVPRHVAGLLGVPCFSPGMILEGGSIDGDGEGTLLTTEACLLNPNRNPQLSRDEIEARLRDFLGVERVLWLGDGIAGDDTDGHVDDLTRFVAPGVVVTVVEEDPRDENHHVLQDNLARLRTMRDARGRALEVVTLPMPSPVEHEGQRLPASYANFYVANAAVLAPTFGCANDERALETLRRLFPGRRVVGIRANDLVWGLGAFHCLTQQQPRA
ncbi:MAG: agmatine deiminase family protein [Thermodesulfobacteriota bacterium]